MLVGRRVRHDDVRSPVDDVEEDESERKDSARDLVDTTRSSLPDVRVHRSRLPPSPHVLKSIQRQGCICLIPNGGLWMKKFSKLLYIALIVQPALTAP